jgi:hypothetical protein
MLSDDYITITWIICQFITVEEKYQAIYKEIFTRAVSEIEDQLGEDNEIIYFI